MRYAVLTVLISLLADCVLKVAADRRQWMLLCLGAGLYLVDALIFFLAFEHWKFIDVGIVYAVLSPLIILIAGVFIFKETITGREIAAILFGLISIILFSVK